jgi:hypothetical protein
MTQGEDWNEALPKMVAVDASVLVVWKPHRLHSLPLAGSRADDLETWVLGSYPEALSIHRLDFETAGLVLFARTEEARSALLAAQAAGRFIKTYRLRAAPVPARASEGLPGSRPPLAPAPGMALPPWLSLLEEGGCEALAARLEGTSITSRFRPFGPGAAKVACLSPDDRRADGRDPRPR